MLSEIIDKSTIETIYPKSKELVAFALVTKDLMSIKHMLRDYVGMYSLAHSLYIPEMERLKDSDTDYKMEIFFKYNPITKDLYETGVNLHNILSGFPYKEDVLIKCEGLSEEDKQYVIDLFESYCQKEHNMSIAEFAMTTL